MATTATPRSIEQPPTPQSADSTEPTPPPSPATPTKELAEDSLTPTPTPSAPYSLSLDPSNPNFIQNLQTLATYLMNSKHVIKVSMLQDPDTIRQNKIKLVAKVHHEVNYNTTTSEIDSPIEDTDIIQTIKQTHELVTQVERMLQPRNIQTMIDTLKPSTIAVSPTNEPIASSTPIEMSFQTDHGGILPDCRQISDLDDYNLSEFRPEDFKYEQVIQQVASVNSHYKIGIIWSDPNWIETEIDLPHRQRFFHGPDLPEITPQLISERCKLAKKMTSRVPSMPNTTPVVQFEISWAPYLPLDSIVPINPLKWPKRQFPWMPLEQTLGTTVGHDRLRGSDN